MRDPKGQGAVPGEVGLEDRGRRIIGVNMCCF